MIFCQLRTKSCVFHILPSFFSKKASIQLTKKGIFHEFLTQFHSPYYNVFEKKTNSYHGLIKLTIFARLFDQLISGFIP